MSRSRVVEPASAGFLAETRLVPIGELHPNSWNVNRLNAFQYAKLLESMTEFGFIDPLLARPCPVHPDFEIVGGEHRWRAARELGYVELPVIIRQMTDPIARKISLIDNELHGQADPVELGSLLRELNSSFDGSELLIGLPFTGEILAGFLDYSSLPTLPAVSPDTPPSDSPAEVDAAGKGEERWVERTYRMPASVAAVLDDALARARVNLDPDAKDFEALEILAAEYLAS